MKTGFDFGAVTEIPNQGEEYYTIYYDYDGIAPLGVPLDWDNGSGEIGWVADGHVFKSMADCKSYCDYVMSEYLKWKNSKLIINHEQENRI